MWQKPQEQEDQRKRKRDLGPKVHLVDFFAKNANPNAAQKASLAEQSNLTVQQVSRWFENKRKRVRLANAEPATTGGQPAEPTAAQAPIILDDSDAEMVAEDHLDCHEQLDAPEQAASTAVAEPAQCTPEQPAGPPEAPAAECTPSRGRQVEQLKEDQAGPSEASAAVSTATRAQLEQLKEEIRELESYVTSFPYPVIPLDKAKMEFCMSKSQVASLCPSTSKSEPMTPIWSQHCRLHDACFDKEGAFVGGQLLGGLQLDAVRGQQGPLVALQGRHQPWITPHKGGHQQHGHRHRSPQELCRQGR